MAKQVTQVVILERDFIVRTGKSLYRTLSSDGVTKYYTILDPKGGQDFCECKGNAEYHVWCRHLKACAAFEMRLSLADGAFTPAHAEMVKEAHRLYDGRNEMDAAYTERFKRQVKSGAEEAADSDFRWSFESW